MKKKEIALNVSCPVCSKSLMDKENPIMGKPSIKLLFDLKGNRWLIRLSPIYGHFEAISEINIRKRTMIKIYCPHCNTDMASKSSCNLCGAPMITLNTDFGATVHFCPRNGCTKHYIAIEELTDDIIHFFTGIK